MKGSATSFKRRLLAWYRSQARSLPWRQTRDPYRIVVSEFMLQQTQVSRVEQFYGRFLQRFPTIEVLSRARPAAVRETWEGLGYYRRAENLHRLARTVVSEHGGVIPRDTETLVTLPGVGRYTAGAVASFAYERRAAAVDTNVMRVLGRYFLKKVQSAGCRVQSTPQAKRIWALASRLLPMRGKTVWEFNQALMDLGATICVARRPRCGICPVRIGCRTGASARK